MAVMTSEVQVHLERERLRSRARLNQLAHSEYLLEDVEFVKAASLYISLENHLAAVEHALYKIEQGTYGICDKCGQQIEPRRLEALPDTALCVACKELEEKHASPSSNGRFFATDIY